MRVGRRKKPRNSYADRYLTFWLRWCRARMSNTTHTEARINLPIQPVFDLISDIESYSRFVPFWHTAKIIQREPSLWRVQQAVSVLGVLLQFDTIARLQPPYQLEITGTAISLNRFHLCWTLAEISSRETKISADLAISFRPSMLDTMARRLLPMLLRKTVIAFHDEALRRRLSVRDLQNSTSRDDITDRQQDASGRMNRDRKCIDRQ